MRLKQISAIVGVALLFQSMGAHASLQSEVESMWSSTATSPGSFTTQQRFGASLGSVSLRSPQKAYTLASFDPPRLQAGCRGVSLYMGAFSFINAEEFRQLLRNIGSAAVGFFFEMALQQLSGQLHAVLTGLAEKVQQLNQMFQNTCRIGKAIGTMKFDDLGSMMPEWLKGKSAEKSQASNETPDGVAAEKKVSEEGTDSADETNPTWGNFLWRALSRQHNGADSGQSFGVSGMSGADATKMKEYMISIFGTVVQEKNLTAGSSCPAGSICAPQTTSYEPTLTFEQFINGNTTASTGLTYLKCNNDDAVEGCLTMSATTLDFKGVPAIIHNMFYGTTDETSDTPRVDSIIYNMRNGKPLSGSQQAFLASFSTPVMYGLLEAQRSAYGFESVVSMAKPFMARELAIRLGEAMVVSVNKAYTGKSGKADAPIKPAFLDSRMDGVRATLSRLRADSSKATEDYRSFVESVKLFRQVSGRTNLSMN